MTGPENIDNGKIRDQVCERADLEATDWLILLQDDPEDAGLRKRFDVWFAASDINAAAWAETRRAVQVVDQTIPVHRAYWNDLPGRGAANGTHRFRWPLVVAVMAVAACLALVVVPSLILNVQADYVVDAGEMQTIELADGSLVHLGAGSAIGVNYGQDKRRVQLLRGTAYFEVRPDPAVPFQVRARDIETTVLGTAFEVQLKDEGASVAVSHGLVRVSSLVMERPISELLEAGETLRVDWVGGRERGVIRPDRVAAWTSGQLIVNNQPVAEVIRALRPWYKGVIITAGSGLDDSFVTGVYDLENPQAALDALAQAHQLSVRRLSPWVTIISMR